MTDTNGLQKITPIDKSAIDETNYFQSLIEHAMRKGLLSEIDAERIQIECLSILSEKTKSFNNGDSSSIRIEIAQSIMTSIAYTIGVYLKTFDEPMRAVEAVRSESVKAIYLNGMKRIETLIRSGKTLHKAIVGKLFENDNEFYRATVVDGINGFFKLYNPEFFAHEIHITADYPVCNQIKSSSGIEFVRAYLDNLYYEDMFCSMFPHSNTQDLFYRCDKNYSKLLMNLYEPVLLSAIGCALTQDDIYSLEVRSLPYIQSLFSGKSRLEIEKTVFGAVGEIFNIMKLSDGLKKYISESVPKLSRIILLSINNNTADILFAVPYSRKNALDEMISDFDN